MSTFNLGKFMLTPRGNYSAGTTYSRLDVVLYQGSSYVCKSDNTVNKIPTNTTYWQLLANAGQATMTPQQKQEIIDGIVSQGVVIDPDYNTFSTEEKQKLADLSAPSNGTLTIKRNGSTVGSFGANQSGNTVINITVPTDYIPAPTAEIITDTDVVIEKVAPNKVYTITQANSMKVLSSQGDDAFKKYSHLPSYIYVKAAGDFDIDMTEAAEQGDIYTLGSTSLQDGHTYRIIVRANVWEIVELQKL